MKLTVVIASLCLVACSSLTPQSASRSYVVQPGDTLYSIAFRYGVDHRSLAAWNNLRNPDLIYAGQRIRLQSQSAARRSSGAGASSAQAASGRTRPSTSRDEPAPAWQWPTRGPIVSSYGDARSLPTGVGIGGRSGQSISAAAAGRVMYAGSGLIGYGQLIIIKHNETYLSAYGHNSRLVVTQGQSVQRGQKIAEMGLGPERAPVLHFEIRRNAAPIDPMPYLRSAG